jgi:peroxiredoxin
MEPSDTNRRSPLVTGDKAPPLTGTAGRGEAVSLDSYRGGKVWVAFFRYTSCTFCGLRIHAMIHRAKDWMGAGLSIIGVFQSPPQAVAEFVRERGVPFPFIGDPSERLYARWGLNASIQGLLALHLVPSMTRDVLSGRAFKKHGTLTRIPADFLIDGEGTIADAYYGRDIGDHIPFERVDDFARSES